MPKSAVGVFSLSTFSVASILTREINMDENFVEFLEFCTNYVIFAGSTLILVFNSTNALFSQ